MTPFGARLRALREARGVGLAELARALHVSAAYLSALEHGHRGRPSPGLIHQVNEYFGLIWDDAEEMVRLARLSHPRVVVDTSGLSPEATALANRLAQEIGRLPPEALARMQAELDALPPAPPRREAPRRRLR
ncbi:helix-turn-helix domain-containing protein [Siccirubricoccus sp. KC 17139]|uniref:Helix-turn-helix domain-containing protein n=1 Tax=Siccirubricoccus soli TaxID=2899147 RepID=A0ABT1D044_9PROT|nr:helix-turn-helix transcriptional regulator [Siccirubricoccus soli]MCO6415284.1 helix-turn-helix domain-containing protein [Siccirubricoccus soli]MCP2681415.1 helix-turn-helix domain-containing protein [Siccirubricoccus soli]